MASDLLSTNNPVFSAYIFYVGVLSLKMLAMSILTARQRFVRKVFANPEDAGPSKGKVKFDDPNVERVRRAHLNDLENITVFMACAFAYMLSNPAPALAVMLFRLFTVARIVHTVVYAVVVVPQPARGLAWGLGYLITGYMALSTVLTFFSSA